MKVLVLHALLVAARWQPRVVTSEPDTHSAREVAGQRILPWLATKAMPAAASFQVPARSSVMTPRNIVTIARQQPRMMAGPPEEDKLGSLLRGLGSQLKPALDGLKSALESKVDEQAERQRKAAVEAGPPKENAGFAPKLPFFLDIGTKGGIVFYSLAGVALPFWAYQYMLDTLKYDIVLAGNVILVGYVGLGTVAWTGTYVFRVANKDMTYAQQLKDYENAVIQKRFEELSNEEVDALMGEIYQPAAGRVPSAADSETARAAAAAAEELAAAVGRMEAPDAAGSEAARQAAAESAVKLQEAVSRQAEEER